MSLGGIGATGEYESVLVQVTIPVSTRDIHQESIDLNYRLLLGSLKNFGSSDWRVLAKSEAESNQETVHEVLAAFNLNILYCV
jgi:hypothetical protein